jgi:hypothetical protein
MAKNLLHCETGFGVYRSTQLGHIPFILLLYLLVGPSIVQKMIFCECEWYCIAKALAAASDTSTRKTFSGRVIHKIFHAGKFKSFLKSKKLLLINSTKVTSMSNFIDI